MKLTDFCAEAGIENPRSWAKLARKVREALAGGGGDDELRETIRRQAARVEMLHHQRNSLKRDLEAAQRKAAG